MRVLLFAQSMREDNFSQVHLVHSLLHEGGVDLYYTPKLEKVFSKTLKISSSHVITSHAELNSADVEYVITLGGDGTILTATTLIRHLAIPILGINLGRLGFLASVEKRQIDKALSHFLSGNFRIEPRAMIYLESNYPLFEDESFALNDFTLHKRDTSSMITIKTYINGDQLNAYWSDGLIVATPTGSTAYSLSCGGPIIFPESGNFVITPVAPHNLNVRPIVISDTSIISFEIEGRSENFLCTLDSRFETITVKHQLAVRKCDFDTHLIQINDNTFLKTLRNKISWGEDNRN
ncbi:MAG: NAD kinase [Saprospiraceae bacterium]